MTEDEAFIFQWAYRKGFWDGSGNGTTPFPSEYKEAIELFEKNKKSAREHWDITREGIKK